MLYEDPLYRKKISYSIEMDARQFDIQNRTNRIMEFIEETKTP